MECTEKKKKSVILAPLVFPTWSNRRMRDRDKLVERRTGKLCWEIKLVIFVQCPALCWQDWRCWCSKKKKKKKKKGNCPALSGSALISLPAFAGATVFSCSWLRHHRHFYSPFPFAARLFTWRVRCAELDLLPYGCTNTERLVKREKC